MLIIRKWFGLFSFEASKGFRQSSLVGRHGERAVINLMRCKGDRGVSLAYMQSSQATARC